MPHLLVVSYVFLRYFFLMNTSILVPFSVTTVLFSLTLNTFHQICKRLCYALFCCCWVICVCEFIEWYCPYYLGMLNLHWDSCRITTMPQCQWANPDGYGLIYGNESVLFKSYACKESILNAHMYLFLLKHNIISYVKIYRVIMYVPQYKYIVVREKEIDLLNGCCFITDWHNFSCLFYDLMMNWRLFDIEFLHGFSLVNCPLSSWENHLRHLACHRG